MKKKHIIISSYDSLGNTYYGGGGARAVQETAKFLSKHYRVTVITGNFPNAVAGEIDGVYYKRIGLSHGGAKISQLSYQLILPLQVMLSDFDLWIENFTPPFSTGMLQLLTKKPVIGLCHMLSGKDMKRKYHLPFDKIESLGLRTYRYIITTTEHDARIIKRLNPNATFVTIPNGVNTNTAKRTKQEPYILSLGRIEVDQKGLDLLLTVYTKLKLKKPIPLIIAGSGEEKQIRKLQSLIRNLPDPTRVIYRGAVDGKAKDSLIKNASCVVITSRFETFSIVSLEALAAGVPLVTFSLPGLSWIPKNAHLSVKQGNTDAMARAIERILQTKSLGKQLGDKGRAFARTFTWTQTGNAYTAFIKSVLS